MGRLNHWMQHSMRTPIAGMAQLVERQTVCGETHNLESDWAQRSRVRTPLPASDRATSLVQRAPASDS